MQDLNQYKAILLKDPITWKILIGVPIRDLNLIRMRANTILSDVYISCSVKPEHDTAEVIRGRV